MQTDRVETVVGWGFRTSAWTAADLPTVASVANPTPGDFGYYWITPDSVRIETGKRIYLYKEGRLYEMDSRTKQARRVEEEEADEKGLDPTAFVEMDLRGPWLGTLLADKVGSLKRRLARERVGSLVCQMTEWSNRFFVERRWQYKLRSGMVSVRYEAVYKDKVSGFVVLSGLVDPRVEQVPSSLFDLPSP
ncbi:MAG: hypothetical protein CFK49_11905 [Armatimonadetes bacterium JP3_11]|jgi:hypothetical protein|nr:MAG: hypothetical protein CFK49_11905 [Armatimonadetes bacterium JP3_11]